MFRKSINSVLIASIAVCIVASFALLIWYVSSSSRDMAMDMERASLKRSADDLGLVLEDYLAESVRMAATLGAQEAVREVFSGRTDRATERFRNYLDNYKQTHWAMFAFDATGKILAGCNAKGEDMTGGDRSKRDYVKAILAGKDTFITPEVLSAQSGTGVLIFGASVSVKDATGKLLGGVAVFPKWSEFTATYLDPKRFGKRGYGYMLDAKGRIIAHAVDKKLVLEDLAQYPFVQETLRVKNGFVYYPWKGEDKFIAVATDKSTGWAICMSAYVPEMTELARRQQTTLLGIGAGACLALIAAVTLISRRLVVQPIRVIEAFTSRVAGGDFKAELSGSFRFELASLATSVRSMVAQLKQKLGFSEGVLGGFILPCAVFDPEDRAVFINRHALQALGRREEPAALLGKSSGEIFYADPGRATLTRKALDERRPVEAEIEIATSDGTRRIFSTTATPFFDMDGGLLGAQTVLFDLTEIRRQQASIQDQNDAIRQAAGAADGLSDRLVGAASQLGTRIEESTGSAGSQRDRLAAVAAGMEEMNATVLEVAAKAAKARELAERTKERAQSGASGVDDVARTIDSISHRAADLSAGMGELGKQAEGIGRIMNVIADIADQTNLLALNAAIEAARAGDAGRGFAVVADEVRKLAEKTMNATSEVGSFIASIQESARKSVVATQETVEAIAQGAGQARNSGQALREIVDFVEETADQVRAIATAAEEQSATSEQINRSTEDIRQLAMQTAEAMDQAAAAVSELSLLANDLRGIFAGKDGASDRGKTGLPGLPSAG